MFGFLILLFTAALYTSFESDPALSSLAFLFGRIAFVTAFPVAGIAIVIVEYWRHREAKLLRKQVAIRLGITPPPGA